MMQTHDEFIRTNSGELRKRIASGLDQVRRGEVVDGKQAIRALRDRLGERARKRSR